MRTLRAGVELRLRGGVCASLIPHKKKREGHFGSSREPPGLSTLARDTPPTGATAGRNVV